MILLIILIAVNIPVYLFIGWIIFDDVRNSAENVLEATVEILKHAILPWQIRDENDEMGIGSIFNLLLFLAACALIVALEYWLLSTYVFPAGAN